MRVGTEVPLRLSEELTTKGKKLRVGQRFHLTTSEPVMVQGVNVVPVGKDQLPHLELTRPVEENLYHFDDTMIRKQGVRTLPGSLEEALEEFSNDEVIQTALGPHVTEWFLEAKRAEWNEYRTQVTDWERERYLMTY